MSLLTALQEENSGIIPVDTGARGGDSESDSDDSLDEQQFADLERLMEQLDNAAVSGAADI
ncbi:MAG: hypothetical protein SGPRY_012740 [Prymnesium sp.]